MEKIKLNHEGHTLEEVFGVEDKKDIPESYDEALATYLVLGTISDNALRLMAAVLEVVTGATFTSKSSIVEYIINSTPERKKPFTKAIRCHYELYN